MRVKRWLVILLERACSRLDWHRPFSGCWLADLSVRLDERWDTGVWVEPDR